jgi:hypothetical protein
VRWHIDPVDDSVCRVGSEQAEQETEDQDSKDQAEQQVKQTTPFSLRGFTFDCFDRFCSAMTSSLLLRNLL